MSQEIENLVRAYRQLWRQEADAIKEGRLTIIRDGNDETQDELARYELWVSDISAMLGRLPDA